MKNDLLLKSHHTLIIDIQATTPNPENSLIIEIGFLHYNPLVDQETNNRNTISRILQIPPNTEIPKQFSKITGIKQEDLFSAHSPKSVWKEIDNIVQAIKTQNNSDTCPTIIHFAQYEKPLLMHLHQQFSEDAPFPFDIFCTHRLSKKLYPQLPRKSLRAVAGYLGFSTPECRRASEHVQATAYIWRQMIEALQERDITTFTDLKSFLDKQLNKINSKQKQKNEISFPMDPEKRKNLPKRPGIYRMKRSNGDILYIGKATSLKQRVNSYFHKSKRASRARQTLEMLTQATDLETTETKSALEAALLETDEIKRVSPPYNVALRKRDREIVFLSRDLMQVNTTPDSPDPAEQSFPVGPLPSSNTAGPLGIIAQMLSKGIIDKSDPELPASALGTLPEYTPETACFNEGFADFMEQHKAVLTPLRYRHVFTRNPLSGIMDLGKRFHLEKIERDALIKESLTEGDANGEDEAEENGKNIGEEGNEEMVEWVWTPEAVVRSLEGIIRHGARMIRRGRWFCLLSECSLAWDTGDTAGEGRRLLVFRGGEVVHRDDLEKGQPAVTPPGYSRPIVMRRRNFNVTVYDRLRVLNTEIRRLVSGEKKRNIQLCFGPGKVMKQYDLEKALFWL